MKVAINTCFGGFGLSPLAIQRYAELKGRMCFFFRSAKGDDGGIDFDRYDGPLTLAQVNKESLFFLAFDISNPNETCVFPDNWHSPPSDEKQKCNDNYWQHVLPSGRDLERNDPLLIQVIEELGSKKASGRCAQLAIIEIPDDVEWEIEEYNGNEHIAERHRTWH